MKREFWYSRKIVIDTDDQFRPVTLEHGAYVGYDHSEVEDQTIIPDHEFKQLAKEVDAIQRKQIREDFGIETLNMDMIRKINAKRRKLSVRG